MPSAPNSIAAPRPPPPSMRPNGNNPGSNPVSQNQNNSRSFQYVPKKRPVLQDDSDESDETDSDWKNSYSVSNSYIQKKKTLKNKSWKLPAEKKTTAKLKKNNSATLKLGVLIMLRDGYTYRKSKKDSQIKQIRRRKKDNFYLQFVSKITDKVTQRIKEKKEQIFRENIYRHHVKINQIKLFAW